MCHLINVEMRNREHPETFHIPTRNERESLMVGDLAKLAWEGAEGGERMWLEILEPREPGHYRGKLLNEPQIFRQMHPGDEVRFRPEHIAALHKENRGLVRRGLIAMGR